MLEGIAGILSTAQTGASASGTKSTKLDTAAREFEALMLSQILKASQDADNSGWLGTDEDGAGSQAIEYAQQQFASALAARGGLGLARMVLDQMGARVTAQDSATSSGQSAANENGAQTKETLGGPEQETAQ